eukprot:4691537-Pleurochrysis_carterae.AAC.1
MCSYLAILRKNIESGPFLRQLLAVFASIPMDVSRLCKFASRIRKNAPPRVQVMDERYVVYFMTAGTKPAQPAVHYCPRSRPRQDAFEVQSPEVEEAALVSRWSAPSLPPREGLAPAGAADTERHIVSSRGVHWKLQGDRVVAKAPAPRGAMPAEAPHALALAERASAISSSLD